MKTNRTLIHTLFAAIALMATAFSLNAQTISADVNGSGMELIIVASDGTSQTVTVAAGEDYSVPDGFTLLSASGAGTIDLDGSGMVSVSEGSSVSLFSNATTGEIGVLAETGSATVTTSTGSQEITAATEAAFISFSPINGVFSNPMAEAPEGFLTGFVPPPAPLAPIVTNPLTNQNEVNSGAPVATPDQLNVPITPTPTPISPN